ncbi:tetratricopeptide repeat protein [Floridanema evergladense]|uniref:Tetratricopeptide repeat protein n=1 Tax=Floridaenema evergladense BLCC-F167 TaxID=3153639 RepID=A0ABV4WHA2_9CYAN
MRVQRQSNGQTITLDAELGGGGEGKIYTILQEPLLVAKVYHKSANGYADKLSVMFANPPEDSTLAQGRVSIAWPVDLLKDSSSQEIIGFLMQRVTEVRPIHDFYIPATRRDKSPYFNYLYLHRTARNLAAAVSALHAKSYVIGDVNESNILVTETALVTLVDTDSFQVLDLSHNKVYRCPVGKPEFTPPELQGKTFRDIDRTPEHDLFGLAVVIFQLLMEGTHPFEGVFQGSDDPPPKEKRILEGHFPYGNRSVPYRSKPLAPPFEILHPTLRQLFIRCFEDGHNDPKARPDAKTWVKALVEAENTLVTCSVNDQHRYGGHLNVCPWCERTVRLGGRDPFPVRYLKQELLMQQQQALPKQKQISFSQRIKILLANKLLAGSTIFLLGLVVTQMYGYFQTSSTPRSTYLNRNDFDKYFQRGYANYKQGNKQAAIADYTQAIQINPNNPHSYYRRGYLRDDLGDKQGAIADLTQAIKLEPNFALAYYDRGLIRSSLGDKQGAIADYTQAIQADPEDYAAYHNRGVVRSGLGDEQGAITDLTQAIRLQPDYAMAYQNRAVIRSRFGDKQGAIEDYQKAAELYLKHGHINRYRNNLNIVRKLQE